jgi:hypothetical protein
LHIVYKIFIDILTRSINVHTDEILGKYQDGFTQDCGTTDHIFTIRQILENQMNRTSVYTSYILTSNKHLTEFSGFI